MDIMTEFTGLVESGWTVTSLMLDGKYIVTATRAESCAAGIGNDYPAAWKMLAQHVIMLFT